MDGNVGRREMKTEQAVQLLRDVAKAGFLSDPQPHWLDKNEETYYVAWLPDQAKAMCNYLADNLFLSEIGRKPIISFFEEEKSYTASLLSRITYSMSKHISPEYVSGLAAELKESERQYSDLFETAELNKML